MIRALRFWHRRWFVLLALILPVLLFLALRERPVEPMVERLIGLDSPSTPSAQDGRP